MQLDKMTFREIECLHIALRLMQQKLDQAIQHDVNVPDDHLQTVASLTKLVSDIHQSKFAEVEEFYEIIEDLDELEIASEIIAKNPDVEIPEYK